MTLTSGSKAQLTAYLWWQRLWHLLYFYIIRSRIEESHQRIHDSPKGLIGSGCIKLWLSTVGPIWQTMVKYPSQFSWCRPYCISGNLGHNARMWPIYKQRAAYAPSQNGPHHIQTKHTFLTLTASISISLTWECILWVVNFYLTLLSSFSWESNLFCRRDVCWHTCHLVTIDV